MMQVRFRCGQLTTWMQEDPLLKYCEPAKQQWLAAFVVQTGRRAIHS
jgi:hypothetical protein